MTILLESLTAAAICVTIVCMSMLIRSLSGEPAPAKGGGAVYTIIAADGGTTELESTVSAALRLRATGAMRSVIVIADAGMNEKTRRIAGILARDSDCILLCGIDEIPMIIGADHWTTT